MGPVVEIWLESLIGNLTLGGLHSAMHYRLRPIKECQFRFANFTSHFIRVQIFQIDFPLILSASNYFRQISLSFYICRGQNEHFSINSVRKKGRVEPFLMILIFDASKLCTDICKTIFVILEVQFHHEGGLSETRNFELFFSTWSILSPYQNSASAEAPFNLF